MKGHAQTSKLSKVQLSYIASILFTHVKFTCIRPGFHILGNSPRRSGILVFLDRPSFCSPPTQAFLGEFVFRPSPETPSQARTIFLSHCKTNKTTKPNKVY